MHVYLFDIDGTLVNAQGVGSEAFRQAAREILGAELNWRGREFAGQTDAGLFARALSESERLGDAVAAERLRELYHELLAANLSGRPATILPGVEQLLASLAQTADAHVGLLTGNTRRGSELKLADLFASFAIGFYGDHHTERTELGRVARDQVNREFGEAEITIIGDTPNDIACARSAQARAVAVATGHFSVDELSAADRVLRNLTEW